MKKTCAQFKKQNYLRFLPNFSKKSEENQKHENHFPAF